MVSGFGYALLEMTVAALGLYALLVVARAVASWFDLDPANPLLRLLTALTEPALAPLRKLVPPSKFGGLDLSPLLLLFLIELLRRGLAYSFHLRMRWSLF